MHKLPQCMYEYFSGRLPRLQLGKLQQSFHANFPLSHTQWEKKIQAKLTCHKILFWAEIAVAVSQFHFAFFSLTRQFIDDAWQPDGGALVHGEAGALGLEDGVDGDLLVAAILVGVVVLLVVVRLVVYVLLFVRDVIRNRLRIRLACKNFGK